MSNKNWPIYFKNNLILGNPKSEVGIVTLWTPTNKIVDKINKNLFCVAGQLYSKDGINFIIRNILANPSIRYLTVCGTDLSGSGKALIDFFKKGVDKDYNIVNVPCSLIHKEIPLGKIQSFRKNVKVDNLIGINDSAKIAGKIKKYKSINKAFSRSQVFPLSFVKDVGSFPTDQSVFKIVRKYNGQAWLEILKIIWRFGRVRDSFYGNPVKEVFNIATVITDENPLNPKLFPYFSITKKDIKKYCESIMNSKRGNEVYTYGERLRGYNGINQVDEAIIPYLKKYPTDRMAVAITFDLTNDHKSSSSPCLCLVQATTLDNKVNLTAYFRSHDLFSGWILNAFGLRHLQKYIAGKLKLKMGTLTIFSNCAHIYDNQWKTVEKIVKKYGEKLECALDPRGYFIINIENKDIVVKLYSPDGLFLEEFRQNGTVKKASMILFDKLVVNNTVSLIAHAFDLGAEIQKAEIAIKLGIPYYQDKPLKFEK
ncbi:MAG: thymidylate synthase [bacterium]